MMTRFGLLAAAVALALIAAACGGDDDVTEPTDTPEPQQNGTEGVAPGDLTAFCDAIVEAEALVIAAAEGDQSADPSAALDQALSEAPDQVAGQVTTLVDGSRTALESQDPSIFEEEDFQLADEEVDVFVVENCGNDNYPVTGLEYEFGGVPDTVAAGAVGFNFINAGEELHEFALVRFNDPSATIEELLDLPEKQAQEAVTRIGFLFANPGEQDAQTFRLDAGTYGVVCFVSTGTTPEKEGDGPPHALQGMYAQFTVE